MGPTLPSEAVAPLFRGFYLAIHCHFGLKHRLIRPCYWVLKAGYDPKTIIIPSCIGHGRMTDPQLQRWMLILFMVRPCGMPASYGIEGMEWKQHCINAVFGWCGPDSSVVPHGATHPIIWRVVNIWCNPATMQNPELSILMTSECTTKP